MLSTLAHGETELGATIAGAVLLPLKLADAVSVKLADGHCGACAGGAAVAMAIAGGTLGRRGAA